MRVQVDQAWRYIKAFDIDRLERVFRIEMRGHCGDLAVLDAYVIQCVDVVLVIQRRGRSSAADRMAAGWVAVARPSSVRRSSCNGGRGTKYVHDQRNNGTK